jgi:hypothetical protein
VRRDAAALLDAHHAGTWTPATERDLAESLARVHWTGNSFRAALRELPPAVRSGHLMNVLEPAIDVLDQAVVDEDTVLQLRVLVDALIAVP